MTVSTQAVADAVTETIHDLAVTQAERGTDDAVAEAVARISGAAVFLRVTLGPERAREVLEDAAALCAAPTSNRAACAAPQRRD